MTSVHFPSNYPIWPLWEPIAWEPGIPFSSEQEVLLFAAATIRHRDRKQILIIVWTHRGKKEHFWVTTTWVSTARLQHTVALCVHFRFQECGLPHDSRWGWGGEWHHRLCSHLNPDTVAPCVPIQPPPPRHLPSEAGLCLALSFLSPSKNTFFSLRPLKQLPAYEVEKMTLHLVMNGAWPLEAAPVGLTQRRIYISQEISRTCLCPGGKNKWRSQRCCKWRLNICWWTSAVNWTTFTAAFLLSAPWFDTHPHWWGCLTESPFVTWLITPSNSYGGINN